MSEKRRARALPWRERYRLTGNIIFALIVTFLVLIVFNVVHAQPVKLTDKQITEKIISESRRAYYEPGHPCACSYDSDWRGYRCSDRSAYGRLGGATPKCYLKDVAKAEIDQIGVRQTTFLALKNMPRLEWVSQIGFD